MEKYRVILYDRQEEEIHSCIIEVSSQDDINSEVIKVGKKFPDFYVYEFEKL